jgi:hypothetical protein
MVRIRMTYANQNSLLSLVERLQAKAPEYLDLMTAETDEEFDIAFDALLEQAVAGLESNSKNFKSLSEEGLTGALAMALSVPGLTVSQETNSNGHVDLTIRIDHCFPMRKLLGEAKIYDGPVNHYKGIQQLLGRYTTGRERRGLVIAYFKKEGISTLVQKLRDKMDADLPSAQQGQTTEHTVKWWFLSKHKHSSDEVLCVAHIGCNLHVSKT